MLSSATNNMKLVTLLIFLAKVTIISVCFVATVNSKLLCIETEKQTILNLKHDLINKNTATDEDHCKWTGILCDNVTGHVTELSLESFTGKINFSLLNLTRLTRLDLAFSDFRQINVPTFFGSLVSLKSLRLTGSGLIPHQLGNLSSLRDLELNGNFKVKSLDWLSDLSSLEVINMGYVNLREVSDQWLLAVNKIPSLVQLHLSNSELHQFHFPPHVNLTSLQVLDLSNNYLTGRIPWAIVNLTALKSLDLSYNMLSGPLPQSLGSLSKLENLRLYRNQLSGPLPQSLGSLSKLENLRLYRNQLSGPLPQSLGSLSNLKILILNRNRLSGPLPKSIGGLLSLTIMIVSHNQLSGSIPNSFGALSNLVLFDISMNQLEGEVSEVHFSSLTKLIQLSAYHNKLTLKVRSNWIPPFRLDVLELGSWKLGPQFPMWLKTQTNFSIVDLFNTGISDTVPSWFWNLSTHFPIVDLSQNQIYGQIPSLLSFREIYLNSNSFNGSLPRISSKVNVLDLSNNSISGDMSLFLCHPMGESKRYIVLILKDNLLSGKIPDCWNHWSEMGVDVIDLSNNNLTGELPITMGLLPLSSLHLRNNSFTGEIPSFLRNYSSMTSIDLGLNKFVGNIPNWLGGLQILRLLSLHSNELTGNIPVELCALESLQILDIGHNNLSGVIPKCFRNIKAMATQPLTELYGTALAFFHDAKITDNAILVTKGKEIKYGSIVILVTMIDLSSNNLSGKIPEELTNLKGLQSLNLSRNGFRGRIPAQIENLTNLESLDLSRNKLCGPIPSSVSSLTFFAQQLVWENSNGNSTARL